MEIEKVLKKTGYTAVITSVILGMIGFIMFIYSKTTLKLITYAIAGLLILVGFIKIIGYIVDKNKKEYFNYDLINGTINAVIGIVLLTHPGILENLLGIILGIWIIYTGLTRLGISLKLKELKSKMWILMLILSIIILAMGIYIIMAPNLIIATLGMIIFIYSIMDLIEGITFLINVRKFEKMGE